MLGTRALSGGKVTVTLPKTAAVRKHTLKVEYVGSSSYLPSTGTVSFTVTKGVAKAPTFKPRGKVSAKKAGRGDDHRRHRDRPGQARRQGEGDAEEGGDDQDGLARLGSSGAVLAKLPRLTKGTWSVKVTYLGDATYLAGRAKAFRLNVTK